MRLGGFVTRFENLPGREYNGKAEAGLSVVQIEGLSVLMAPEMANGGFRLGTNVTLHVRCIYKMKGPDKDIAVPQFWLLGEEHLELPLQVD